MSSRSVIWTAACVVICTLGHPLSVVHASGRVNILLITADDMNHDAPGFTGSKVSQITPNLDRLASQSLRFVAGPPLRVRVQRLVGR